MISPFKQIQLQYRWFSYQNLHLVWECPDLFDPPGGNPQQQGISGRAASQLSASQAPPQPFRTLPVGPATRPRGHHKLRRIRWISEARYTQYEYLYVSMYAYTLYMHTCIYLCIYIHILYVYCVYIYICDMYIISELNLQQLRIYSNWMHLNALMWGSLWSPKKQTGPRVSLTADCWLLNIQILIVIE